MFGKAKLQDDAICGSMFMHRAKGGIAPNQTRPNHCKIQGAAAGIIQPLAMVLLSRSFRQTSAAPPWNLSYSVARYQ